MKRHEPSAGPLTKNSLMVDIVQDMQDEELEATVKASQAKEKHKTKKATSHADMRDEDLEATMQTSQAKTKHKKKKATSNA